MNRWDFHHLGEAQVEEGVEEEAEEEEEALGKGGGLLLGLLHLNDHLTMDNLLCCSKTCVKCCLRHVLPKHDYFAYMNCVLDNRTE